MAILPNNASVGAVNGWADEWDKQANRHAFLGQRYILALLTEIYPPFMAIMNSHTDQFAKPREWKPIIYKVISDQNNVAYVIGTCHFECVRLPADRLASISSQLKTILMQTNAIALEFFDPDALSRESQRARFEIQYCKYRPSKEIDSFNSIARLRACNAGFGTINVGLESHIRAFIVQNRLNSFPAFISLESEEIQIKAMDELFKNTVAGSVVDLEQGMAELDLVLEGNEEDMERYLSGKHRKFPFLEDEHSVHALRDKSMAKAIPEIMEKHKNVVIAVGMGHSRGIISQLRQHDNLKVELLPYEEVANAPSYNPNHLMVLRYPDVNSKDDFLWKSNS